MALARGEQAAFAGREHLIRVLGLWGAQTCFTLATTLPTLPASPTDTTDLEGPRPSRPQQAASRAPELATQASYAPCRPTWTNAGMRWATPPKCARKQCWCAAKRAKPPSTCAPQWDIAHHLQTEVVPLRQFIHDELTLRYNGMLTSVFEVMADSRTRTLNSLAAAEALRDYWLAFADVQAVLAGVSPEGSAPARTGAAAGSDAKAGALSARHHSRICMNRRNFFNGAAATAMGAVAAASVSRVAMAALPEPVLQSIARHHAAAWCPAPAGPTTRWSHSTAGPCHGA